MRPSGRCGYRLMYDYPMPLFPLLLSRCTDLTTILVVLDGRIVALRLICFIIQILLPSLALKGLSQYLLSHRLERSRMSCQSCVNSSPSVPAMRVGRA